MSSQMPAVVNLWTKLIHLIDWRILSLSSRCKSLWQFSLLPCGDMNACTSESADYITHGDVRHMNLMPEDYSSDVEMKRYSQDTARINTNGLQLLDLCKQTGLRIFNGRAGNDMFKGQHTFVGHQDLSLVDYVLGTQDLLKYVTKFDV